MSFWVLWASRSLRFSRLRFTALLKRRLGTDTMILFASSSLEEAVSFRKQYLRPPDVKPQRPLDIRAEIFDFP